MSKTTMDHDQMVAHPVSRPAVSPGDVASELEAKFLARLAKLEGQSETEPYVYDDLSVNEGHAQGDVRLQFLGDRPDLDKFANNDTVSFGRREIRMLDGRVEFPTTGRLPLDSVVGTFDSHYIEESVGLEVYRPAGSNPLVGFFCRLASPGELRVTHHEHRTAVFQQPGWYVARFDRGAAVSDEAAFQSLVRVHD